MEDDFYDGGWDEEVFDPFSACIDCGEQSCGDVCAQCGMPLCMEHAEGGAGFCRAHPDEHFRGY